MPPQSHQHNCNHQQINRSLISPGELVSFGTEALDELESSAHWTTVVFDQLMAVALLHFGRADVGYMVLETGIGGRFDSTNFHDAPAACVITSIRCVTVYVCACVRACVRAFLCVFVRVRESLYTSILL